MSEHDKVAVFLCYRQERFVEQALRAMLAQAESLHVWLLDDASPDATWQVVNSCLQAMPLQGATHSIEPLPASVNGGLARNWNRVIPLLREQWIYVFEGDDVSMPDRVADSARFAAAHPSMAVFSCRVIENSAAGISEVPARGSGGVFTADAILAKGFPELPGCSLVLRRDIFTQFGRLNWRLMTVDFVLIRRGFMLGDVGLLEQALVSYRKHDANVSRVFVIRFDSLQGFQQSMVKIQHHTLGTLHEAGKLWRFAQRHCAAGSARWHIARGIYREARAHTVLGLASRRGSRIALFRAALANLVHRREHRLSKWALVLALWSGAWSGWQNVKRRLRAALRPA